jgi:MscS family membrane protein
MHTLLNSIFAVQGAAAEPVVANEAAAAILKPELQAVLITAGSILAGAILVHMVFGLLLRRVSKLQKGHLRWGGIAAGALQRPLAMGVWVIAALLLIDEGLNIGLHASGDSADFVSIAQSIRDDVLPAARSLAVVLAVTLFVVGFLKGCLKELERRLDEQGGDVTAVQGLGSMAVAVVWVLGVLTGLDSVGVNTTAVVAILGLSSAGLAFAAKDLLGNFFGGIMLLFNRPFEAGDAVIVDKVSGVIERIGLYATLVRGPDKRLIWIPNMKFTASIVENPSRRTHRRFDETIGLRYDDLAKAPAIIKDLQDMLEACPLFDHEQARRVRLSAYGDSTVDINMLAYSSELGIDAYSTMRQELMLQMGTIVHSHGADFAFPTVTLDGVPNVSNAQN